MSETENSIPGRNISISDRAGTFSIPAFVKDQYFTGHICTENEAAILNQTRAENIGNIWRPRVRSALEKNQPLPTSEEIEAYAETYALRLVGGRNTDPLMNIAREIAESAIKDEIRKSGRKMKEFNIPELVDELLNNEQYSQLIWERARKLAKAQAEDQKKIAGTLASFLKG